MGSLMISNSSSLSLLKRKLGKEEGEEKEEEEEEELEDEALPKIFF